jgi:regulatory protein
MPPQLNDSSLQELALRYVGKYATTRAKLRSYLSRKLRERGWSAEKQPDLHALAERFAELGYVNDAAYALSKSRALSARGYGKRRLGDTLRLDGVDERDQAAAHALADEEAVSAALRFAQRKRLGPFAATAADPRQREKWIASMIRAGHGLALARTISAMAPGAGIELDSLREQLYRREANLD